MMVVVCTDDDKKKFNKLRPNISYLSKYTQVGGSLISLCNMCTMHRLIVDAATPPKNTYT